MNLTLTVSKSPSGGAPVGTFQTVGDLGATIGRSDKNTWVLPSVEGDGVSREHARIVYEGGAFSVMDAKSTYGVFVNDVQVKRGSRARLNDGDRLRLGEYEFRVEAQAPSEPDFEEQASEPESDEPPITPFEWDDPPAPKPPRARHLREEDGPMRQDNPPDVEIIQVVPIPTPKRRIIPESWAEPASETPQERPRQPPGRQLPPLEPSLEPEEEPPQPLARPHQQPERRLPPLETPPQQQERPVASRPPPSGDGFAAFLAGAALRLSQSGVDSGAALHTAGETYRVAVEGISEILVSRNQVKDEFGIEKTRIAMAENNPLKSRELSSEEKLSMMIAGNRAAFMPAPAAMKEALRDIKEHELALIAAIQVALKNLLEQIDPKTLEDRLEKRWLLDDIVPAARKARIWEIYELKHAEIARELEEDFQGAFGRAFAQAYEQYVRRR
jgi:type VI secretion system FHA domain protein